MAEEACNVSIEIPSELPSEIVEDPVVVAHVSGTPHLKPPLHSKRKVKAKTVIRNKRRVSDVWEHFTRIPDVKEGEEYAACNYCDTQYACNSKRNGTTTLMRHLEKLCNKFPRDELKQTVLTFEKGEDGCSKLKAVSFNQNEARVQLAKMVIIDELPFRVVDGEGFNAYSHYLQPRFKLPHRTTLASDCMKLYEDEKTKLKRLIKNQRLCFTTDTWTSVQNLNYMCLTGHWTDKDWVYQKRLINFCPISDHKGQTIGDAIEACFIEWGIEKVLTITVDNVSSNDAAIRTLKSSTGYMLKDVILNHDFLHMRCCAHIVNLIVQSGLKELVESVIKIRRAIKYVKSSSAREKLFNTCVKAVHIESKKGLRLDVETRWNSTYLMLEAAEKYERAFNRLERDDRKFVAYFYSGDDDEAEVEGDFESNNIGRRRTFLSSPHRTTDWENARYLVKFLEMFYEVTKKFSASTTVTANEFFHGVVQIQTVLMKFVSSTKPSLGNICSKMMVKFNKYWGDFKSINGLLYIAIILDPRYKIEYVKYTFEQIYIEEKAKESLCKVDAWFARLYEHYQDRSRKSLAGTSSGINQVDIEMGNDEIEEDDFVLGSTSRDNWDKKIKVDKSVDISTDLSKYLNDPLEENCANFNLLNWWKVNASKYPIIAEIAHDVLAIPVSTVASESAFSTDGRVLDPYRSSLNPSTVQALLCTQNWFRTQIPKNFEDILDPLEEAKIAEPNLNGLLGRQSGTTAKYSFCS